MKKLFFIIMLTMASGNAYGETGSEGSACYANSTCDTELVCLSKLCVKDDRKPEGVGLSWNGIGAVMMCLTIGMFIMMWIS